METTTFSVATTFDAPELDQQFTAAQPAWTAAKAAGTCTLYVKRGEDVPAILTFSGGECRRGAGEGPMVSVPSVREMVSGRYVDHGPESPRRSPLAPRRSWRRRAVRP